MSNFLFIDGQWSGANSKRSAPIYNPANGEEIGRVPFAEREDLDRALEAAQRAFLKWRLVSSAERSDILRRAAAQMRQRNEEIAQAITREQGKPLYEARMEASSAADHTEWNAEEARRCYGRVIPGRTPEVVQMVLREPVGPVLALSPWNFPLTQLVRKVAAALAAGCTVIGKAPEETPTCAALMAECFAEAGLPAGALNLVFGVPQEISSYLIAAPEIAKVSFTGSIPVGRQLSELAGRHLKRTTMELGGHAPVLVTANANIKSAVAAAVAAKHRNAGQVCASPTRFLVHQDVYLDFLDQYTEAAKAIRYGAGTDSATQMGPLAHGRRPFALDMLVQDAVQVGATLNCGGVLPKGPGYYYPPTVISDVPLTARVMHEEPFGPLSIINPMPSLDAMLFEANRLPVGLAAYAFTSDLEEADRISAEIQAGAFCINHNGLGLPEIPFGGIKDSGHGSEGGTEGIMPFLQEKLVSRRRV
ncbi:NAD-dependent succinate-semialdehyde dehydrogenase [Pseudomonas sp. NPDC088444]|uniref:NAD-dependent succinate-semialdehyde dehydrogenase n=1 Tax=Pseudomonas sp. NPDC088444 TaxID=3364456 RepID=UPI00384A9317